MEVYLFLGLHNSYFPPDIDFQVLVQVVSSKSPSDKSHSLLLSTFNSVRPGSFKSFV